MSEVDTSTAFVRGYLADVAGAREDARRLPSPSVADGFVAAYTQTHDLVSALLAERDALVKDVVTLRRELRAAAPKAARYDYLSGASGPGDGFWVAYGHIETGISMWNDHALAKAIDAEIGKEKL